MSDEPRQPAAEPAHSPLRPVPMLDYQRELAAALADKDQRLSNMYVGCLDVLRSAVNPDSIHLAAHAARELMRFVPEVLDLPWKAHSERLGDKVQILHAKWTSATAKSIAHKQGPVWDGQIDAPLKTLLAGLDEFFAWKESHMPRRRIEAMAVLTRLEASHELPRHLQEANATRWEALAGYFNNVAHHGLVPERADLEQHVSELEEFLQARLRPRTFDDFAEIDALLGGAESR